MMNFVSKTRNFAFKTRNFVLKMMHFAGHRRIVAGMIAALDEGVGNITAAVEANGLADSITMMFTTDKWEHKHPPPPQLDFRGGL